MVQLADDLLQAKMAVIPRDLEAFEKLHVTCMHGTRVYWYSKEDEVFATECGESVKDDCPFSGLLVAAPDANPQRELDPEDCIVIMDKHPVEKCDIEVRYMALSELLDNDDLVEVYEDTLG